MCIVHNETSTGITLPLGEIRHVIDAARHPALLLADTISSLGSIDFRMDEWGVDGVVGGSQKGLMLPTGLGFTGVSAKGMAAHRSSTLPKHYFNWSNMIGRRHKSFVGTVPTGPFYGMREALRIIEEEGLEEVFARHHRLAEAVRASVRRWAGNNGPQLFCTDPQRLSDSVTAVLMPEGHDAEAVRQTALERFNVSLGGGPGQARRPRVPHRAPRRPQRADGARHPGRGRAVAPAAAGAARQRRGGRRDGLAGGAGSGLTARPPLPLRSPGQRVGVSALTARLQLPLRPQGRRGPG